MIAPAAQRAASSGVRFHLNKATTSKIKGKGKCQPSFSTWMRVGIFSCGIGSICLRAALQEIKIEQLLDNDDIPNEYICPISQKLMINPVTTLVGNTYEEEYIKKWLENHDTDPLFNETLKNKNLIENKGLKETISDWIGKL